MSDIIIAIDFDGTIVEITDKTKLKPKAAEAIMFLAEQGNLLILNSCRVKDQLEAAKTVLKANSIYGCFSYVNQNAEIIINHYKVESRKISADMYIDDRNFGGFPGWEIIIAYFKEQGFHDIVIN